MAEPNGTRPAAAGDVTEGQVARLQARAEGVVLAQTVEFFGATYRLAPRVPLMALLDFAAEAAKGTATQDEVAMAVMRDLIRRCFVQAPPCRNCKVCAAAGELAEEVPACPAYDPGDWPRFRVSALDHCAGADELFEVVSAVIEMETSRPTSPASGSSRKAPPRSARSRGRSSSPGRVPEAFRSEQMVPVDDLLRSRG